MARFGKALALLGTAFLVATSPGLAWSANLDVQPTTLHLSPSKPTGVLTVVNRGEPASFQLRTFAWAQRGGKDVLDATQAVLASPPIFTLGSGERQTIRLHHRGAAARSGEETFRVLLDELPSRTPDAGTLSILLQLSLPVFLHAGQGLAPRLSVQEILADDHLRLRVYNQGTSTAKLGAAAFSSPRGGAHRIESLRYVLPGSFVEYLLPRRVDERLAVDLLTDDGWQRFDVGG